MGEPAGRRKYLALPAAFMLAVAAEAGVAYFTKRQGVKITGDEPHYLIEARALSHFSPHVLWVYQQDLRAHYFNPWPANAPVTSIMHASAGSHGYVGSHGLGVSLLIMPFLVLGGKNLAFAGFFAIEAAGLIYLHQRASWLVGLTKRGQVLFGLAIAGPALWIAATQLYPDLLTGILLACALIEVAVVERDGTLNRWGTWAFAFSMALLPWLHVKNLLPAALTCAAFAAVAVRARAIRSAGPVVGLVGASWIGLLAYNLYFFGQVLGAPQPTPALSKAGLAMTLALLFDRHQGLLVQLPTAVLGLAGLWLARRKAPISVIATVLAVGAVIALNGSYVRNPFGGDALAGRFEWTAMPVLLCWCPYLIAKLDTSRARAAAVGAAIVVIWALQSLPIISGHHEYYNASGLWDPSLYPGWWSHFDRIISAYTPGGNVLGAPWYAFAIIASVLAVAVVVLLRLARPDPVDGRRLGGGLAVVAAAVVALSLVVSRPLPARSLSYRASDLGGDGPSVTLPRIGSGTFRGELRYTLSGGPGPGQFTLDCSAAGASTANSLRRLPLPADAHAAVATVDCPAGSIRVQLTGAVDGSLVLTKLAN